MLLKQIIILLLLAVLIGLGLNLVSPNKIEYFGKYRSLSRGEGPIVPPSAEPGDPPFIAVDVAEFEHSNQQAMFIDAREPEEYICGTIPGSINIPFDYLPEENLAIYIDSALGGIAKNYQLIVFCSGEECDLSLHLARNLQAINYTNISIFFGGAREWEEFDLEIERRQPCEE
ncbi:MAG: rhodanese-like domain-containing protein [Candidatus Zixiibacteriota bacterium]